MSRSLSFSPVGSPRSRSPVKFGPGGSLFVDSSSPYADMEYHDPRNEFLSPGWRKPPDSTVGYSGHVSERKEDVHVLESPLRKPKVGGYSGFIPQTKNICGTPIIRFESPSESKNDFSQFTMSPTRNQMSNNTSYSPTSNKSSPRITEFRNYGKHMDVEERYAQAVLLLRKEHNQTQEILLHILQSKLAEKLNSYAQQTIRTRKMFEFFDKDRDGRLDEDDFRDMLENQNVQFDDEQILALFAYFDRGNTGYIDWEGFAENVMVYNPKGGNAVLPKMITQTIKSRNDN